MMEVLLNSLWQGAFVVAIAAGVAALVPQRHAATRYAVWFVALFALAVLPIASRFSFGESALAIPSSVIRTTSVASHVTESAASSLGLLLAIAWAAGIALNVLRLALSYLRIARIVRFATPSTELGAGVRTSSLISIPIAAGLLHPVVVIPDALAARLDPVDVRSIVAHERAHITRNDILGNLVQRLYRIDIVFQSVGLRHRAPTTQRTGSRLRRSGRRRRQRSRPLCFMSGDSRPAQSARATRPCSHQARSARGGCSPSGSCDCSTERPLP